jgi:hypothetical protein
MVLRESGLSVTCGLSSLLTSCVYKFYRSLSISSSESEMFFINNIIDHINYADAPY